ncbi:ABC transporter ATP-binding protein [Tannerella sp. oral taxon 808]|nr:ABC transporter ATP-binding protein [Tannerella sp. oral taxon 808]
MTSAIDIRDLRKTYRGAAAPSVDGLTLHVAEGEFFGLLGPNGAGKTTTLSILAGLLPFDSGTVHLCGLDVRRDNARIRRLIGVVPQDIALYPELTTAENLHFFGRMHGLPTRTLRERINADADRLALRSHLNKRIEHLSGGMKRKLNLLVALLHRPRILFLDEPTVGVDVHSRQEIIAHLRALNADGMTIVYTSHDMVEAEQLCTRVALMNRGATVCVGTPDALLAEARMPSLEALFIARTEEAGRV